MNKTNLLKIIIGLLILLNIAVLSFLVMGRKPPQHPPHNKGHANKVIENFDFDDAQINLYKISMNKHMEQSKSITAELEEVSLAYYKLPSSNATKDSLYSKIESISKKIYTANDTHFDEVRKICTADQLPEMDHFIQGLIGRNGPRDKKRKDNQ